MKTAIILVFILVTSVYSLQLIADDQSSSTYISGLEGTTSYVVVSGIPDREKTVTPAPMEFMVYPILGDKPDLEKGISVSSNEFGKYKVTLPPGKYLVKGKGPFNQNYQFIEKRAIVTQGEYSKLDLESVGNAP